MKKDAGAYRLGVGATSLMMILVILALTALSVISYLSARSELAVARRSQEVSAQVYAAMDAGYDALAELDAALRSGQGAAEAAQALGWQAAEGETWTLSLPATEQLRLEVRVRLEADEGGRFTVTGFATVPQGTETEGWE